MKKIMSFISMCLVAGSVLAAPITTIRFATDATYPPFEEIDASGKIQGFDIDIANALCQQLKATCTFSNQPWDSLIPSLQLGKFDALIAAMSITAEREKQVDFTNPYYINKVGFVAPKSENLQISAAGLKGKTIGVQTGTTFANYLQATYGNTIKVNTYGSQQDAFLDLTAGRVDAVMGDMPLLIEWLKRNKNNNYEIVGEPIVNEQYFGGGENGIAVKKGNAQLVNALNQALAAIKANGTYNKIVEKYFGNNQ